MSRQRELRARAGQTLGELCERPTVISSLKSLLETGTPLEMTRTRPRHL